MLESTPLQKYWMQNSKIISKDLLKEYIDFDPKDQKKRRIVIKVFVACLNLKTGSDDSLESLTCIQDALPEAFPTPFIHLMRYKWL